MTAGGGHDDQILAEPTRGVVEAVSDGFGLVTLDASAVWRRVLGADRLGVHLQAQGTEYLSGVLGLDGNLLMDASWYRVLGSRNSLQIEGLGWAFRREDMEDFNLNAWRVSGRLTWSASRALLLAAGPRYQQVGFTDRFVTPDTTLIAGPGDVIVFPLGTDTETDRQTDLVATVLWRRGKLFASGEGVYRWARSNEPLVAYEGPQGALRLGSRFERSDLVLYLSAARRTFSEPYLLGDVAALREDRVVQLGLFVDRSLSSHTRIFADWSWLRQESDIQQFAFDQVQVQLGVKVSLLQPATGLRAILELGPPPAAEGPVVFRYKGPGAESVSLVGDFNGWDPGAHPMARVGKGRWELAVALDSGIWRYAFVVDGQWVTPPEAAQYEDDGFGGRNAVLIVQ